MDQDNADHIIRYLEAQLAEAVTRINNLETDVQVYWDSAKQAEELLTMVYEKLKQGKNYEALKLMEEGGE